MKQQDEAMEGYSSIFNQPEPVVEEKQEEKPRVTLIKMKIRKQLESIRQLPFSEAVKKRAITLYNKITLGKSFIREDTGGWESFMRTIERFDREAQPAQASSSSSNVFASPPIASLPPPMPVDTPRQALARRYTDNVIRGMNKDEARGALRELGGNPRIQGSKEYESVERVKEMIRQKVRQILG
jgi:hypothetical protein